MLFAINLVLYEVSFIKIRKLPLKYTKRIIRLILFIILFSVPVLIYPFIYPFINLIIILPFFISSLLEKIINTKYLTKAVTKINSFKGDIIAITGSYGKTTTKVFTAQLLEELNPFYTMKSYNTPMGISKAINNSELDLAKIMILEFGATKLNNISYLTKKFKPNIAIVTEIGPMHLNTFKSIENILFEKMKSVESLKADGLAIINYENEYLRQYEIKNTCKIISYGINYGEYRYNLVDEKTLIITRNNKFLYKFVHTSLSSIDISNLMPGIILGIHYGMNGNEIGSRILNIKKPKSRLEEKHFKNMTILDDSFNANLKGALNALDKLSMMIGIKYVITPGIVEQDKLSKENHLILAKKMKEVADIIFIINSKTGRTLYKHFTKNAYLVNSFDDAFFLFNLDNRKRVLLIENDLPDIYEYF